MLIEIFFFFPDLPKSSTHTSTFQCRPTTNSSLDDENIKNTMNSPQYISEVLSDSSYTTTHNYSKTPTPEIPIEYQSDEKVDLSESILELQNKKNTECEKSNKKCKNGLCYCFSSDSDDVRIKPKFIRPNSLSENVRLSSGSSIEPNKSSDDDSSVFNECANSRSKLNKSDSIVLRARGRRKKEGVKVKRRVKSNENFVEKKNSSFKRIVIRITSMREESSEDEEEEEEIFEESESEYEEEVEEEEPPLLRIVQEITQTKTISSKVTVNKAKLRELNESKKKRENIIDDNFCNEILDKTMNWERLEEEILSREIEEKNQFSFGKLEANPKYSGKNVGRLLAKRNKRAEKLKNVYKETVICGSERTFSEEYVSTDSNSNRTGPKKPPRTFASNSSKYGGNSNTTMELDEELDLMRRFQNLKNSSGEEKIGWTFLANNPKKIIPTCPTLEDINWVGPEVVEKKIGWTFLDQNKANSPPQHILNMLDFDDRKNNQLISSFLKAEQQQDIRNFKEDIDTVDGLKSPIRNDFENFVANTTVKSTPREGKEHRKISQEIKGRNLDFSENENFCPNCSKVKKPKKSLTETTIKRTKSFFETTQRKINFKSKKSKSIESVTYSTPQKNDLTSEANKNQFSGKKFNKNLDCDDCPPEKPIRRSLIKDSKSCSENSTPNKNVPKPIEKDYFNFDRIIKSPKTRFCLENLRITPKKLFTTPKKSENVTPSYKSYADKDQDITALMGEFLLNMSSQLENKNKKEDDEPIYEEIRLPRARKSLNENFLESSKNHFTVNNDLYAKIDFNKKFKKSKSLSNLQKSPELNNSINSIKNKSNTTLFNSNLTINDISPIKNSNLNLQAQIHMEPSPIDDGNYFQNSELNFMENNSMSNVGGRREVSSYDASKFLRAALGDDMVIGSRDSIQYVDEDDFRFYPEKVSFFFVSVFTLKFL